VAVNHLPPGPGPPDLKERPVYATNGNITIHTHPDGQIIIITDRFGTAIHLSPADAEFVRDALEPVDVSP
jgi:hypothetical protein